MYTEKSILIQVSPFFAFTKDKSKTPFGYYQALHLGDIFKNLIDNSFFSSSRFNFTNKRNSIEIPTGLLVFNNSENINEKKEK